MLSELNSKFLSIKNAAEWLGVCDKTIRRELMDGHLKSLKSRNKVLIPVSSLEAYVKARLH